MSKQNEKDLFVLPRRGILRLSTNMQLVARYPSIQAAAAAVGVKPETIYSYCRKVGETLKGSYFMAY